MKFFQGSDPSYYWLVLDEIWILSYATKITIQQQWYKLVLDYFVCEMLSAHVYGYVHTQVCRGQV